VTDSERESPLPTNGSAPFTGEGEASPRTNVQIWEGRVIEGSVPEDLLAAHHQIAKAAGAGEWTAILELLAENPFLVNACRPSDEFGYAPLHRAAWLGAPRDVILAMLALGAWRALRTPSGKRPTDIARRRGHEELASMLEPPVVHRVATNVLMDLERHFHALIYGRVANLIVDHCLRLPQLECLLEMTNPSVTFFVPGMYGGFQYQLRTLPDGSATLHVSSWNRIDDTFGERHEVTSKGYQLLDSDLH
jgi:hypothetical protein